MKKNFSVMVTALLLGACSLVPDYHRPAVQAPGQWSAQQSDQTRIAADWWTEFGSDELNRLMQEALARNNDLRASLARVDQARAGLRIAGASLLPTADASLGATRTRSNPASGPSRSDNAWRAGAGISYELDLFGANRAGADAARAQLWGSEYDRDALALVVMGDVANAYFNILNLRARLAIAEANLKLARDVLGVVQARFDAGASSALELSQQKTALANNEATLASLRNQLNAAENALSVLLAQPPQGEEFAGDNLKDILVPAVAAGQPSELLERRPDIRSAEASLLAANANIGAARAAFYPSVNLGLDGSASWSPLATALSLSSGLVAPLFSGGRLEGSLDSATARQIELTENYRKTVYNAFREVEDALSAARAAQARQLAFAEALREAEKSYNLSRELYIAGSIDFQTLLNTQSSLFSAQDSAAAARLEMLNAAIDLYKALGGGWQ